MNKKLLKKAELQEKRVLREAAVEEAAALAAVLVELEAEEAEAAAESTESTGDVATPSAALVGTDEDTVPTPDDEVAISFTTVDGEDLELDLPVTPLVTAPTTIPDGR